MILAICQHRHLYIVTKLIVGLKYDIQNQLVIHQYYHHYTITITITPLLSLLHHCYHHYTITITITPLLSPLHHYYHHYTITITITPLLLDI